MSEQVGKRTWVFPDGEMPQPGEFPVKGHESIIILNPSDETAICRLSVYFTDREPYSDIVVRVEPRRVRCIRTNNLTDMCGYVIQPEEQYAMKWDCSAAVVMQYGRLDTTDQPMHFYINQGFSE